MMKTTFLTLSSALMAMTTAALPRMKRLPALLAFLSIALLAFADNHPPTLVITTKDQVQHEYQLTDKAQVTFEGKELVVSAPGVNTSYPLSDVLRFNYKDVEPSDVDALRNETPDIGYQNGSLMLTHLKCDATVSIYDATGKLVRQLKASRNGTHRISLEQLPLGVYIVKAGTTTFKIARQ